MLLVMLTESVRSKLLNKLKQNHANLISIPQAENPRNFTKMRPLRFIYKCIRDGDTKVLFRGIKDLNCTQESSTFHSPPMYFRESCPCNYTQCNTNKR